MPTWGFFDDLTVRVLDRISCPPTDKLLHLQAVFDLEAILQDDLVASKTDLQLR